MSLPAPREAANSMAVTPAIDPARAAVTTTDR